jgi:hypothetical protein
LDVPENLIKLLKDLGNRIAEERPRSDGLLNELRDLWLKYPLPDFADIGDIKVTVLASVQDMGDDLVLGSLKAMQIRANMLESWVLGQRIPKRKVCIYHQKRSFYSRRRA